MEVRQPGGSWGTVCDDHFDDKGALVICKMLGFTHGKKYCDALLGEGQGEILMDELACTGAEDDVFSCKQNEWGSHDCHHTEDAGVRCERPAGLS